MPMTTKTEAILAVVRAIPPGQTCAYGEVARRAGLPRAARLVARVLAACDDPRTPWHRVVRADGCIGFPQGSEGFEAQVARLRSEGLVVRAGRVRGASPRETVDALVWAPVADQPKARSR